MISWTDLKLGNPAQLRFSNGKRAEVRFLEQSGGPLQSRQKESALISYFEYGSLDLAEVVDSSPNHDEPCVLVISGNSEDRLFLFGGETCYIISSEGKAIGSTPTFRKRRNAEFWRTEVVSLDNDSLLIVYEVGALVIDSMLKIRWQVEKALIDFFERREGSELIFLRDHEAPYSIELGTGRGVPPIDVA